MFHYTSSDLKVGGITGQEGSCRRWAGTTAEGVVLPDGVAISVLDLAPPSERAHWTKLHTWDLCTFSCVCSEKVFPTPLSSSSEKLRCGQKAMPTLHVSKRSCCRSPCCSEVKACQAQALYPHPLLLLHSWQQLSSEVLEAEAFWQRWGQLNTVGETLSALIKHIIHSPGRRSADAICVVSTWLILGQKYFNQLWPKKGGSIGSPVSLLCRGCDCGLRIWQAADNPCSVGLWPFPREWSSRGSQLGAWLAPADSVGDTARLSWSVGSSLAYAQ